MTLHWLTSRHRTASTRQCIHWSFRTLQHYFTRYLLHYYCSMLPYRLPHDHPYQGQKDNNSSKPLISDIMLKFGFPRILHSDNGMKFKFKLIENLFQQLGIKKTYISSHHPQANENWNLCIDLFVIQKFSVDGVPKWDQLFPYATVAFNWFPNEHSQESPHFLYSRCDPYLPHLAAFLQSKLRYIGSDKGVICLDKLRQAYMLAALNIKEACSNQSKQKYDDIPNSKIVDLVMIRNFDKISDWDAK